MIALQEQHMKADNDTLIITDPCYLLKEEDWDEYTNLAFSNSPVYKTLSLDEYLRKYHNFGEVIAADTGIGDWSNSVYVDDDKDTVLGSFSADAGMVAVFTASDLSNYGYDEEELKRLVSIGCATIIPDYSGDVVLEYERTQYDSRIAVITGTGETKDDISWSTWRESKV